MTLDVPLCPLRFFAWLRSNLPWLGFGLGNFDPVMSLKVEQYMERQGHRKYEVCSTGQLWGGYCPYCPILIFINYIILSLVFGYSMVLIACGKPAGDRGDPNGV